MPAYRLTITLTNGAIVSRDVRKMPRAWKSWIMHECPYGTAFYGATFTRETIS